MPPEPPEVVSAQSTLFDYCSNFATYLKVIDNLKHKPLTEKMQIHYGQNRIIGCTCSHWGPVLTQVEMEAADEGDGVDVGQALQGQERMEQEEEEEDEVG